MDIINILVVALASYRVATDLAWESGPFLVFERVRGAIMQRGVTWLTEGITCPICLSFWVTPVLLYVHTIAPIVTLWFAIAGAVALVVRQE